jgi:Bacterial Ig-like domain/Fibronectin type III domain
MRKFILAALFVSSLLACNPGTPTGTSSPPDPSTPPPVTDPTPPDPSAPDTTAPTITLSQPESNDAAINSSILVNFSEPMKSETVSVTLEPNVNLGAGEWKSEEVIEFVPTSDFAPESTYKVNVTGKDVAGNLLSGSSTYQFKTSKLKDTTAPNTPQGLNAVAEEEQVRLTWTANKESDLKGYTVQYGKDANNLSSKTFVSKPGSSKTITGLTGGTPYYFTLIAEDRSGNKSKRSSTVNAKPKIKPPVKLVSSSPANNATDVGTSLETLSFTFSRPMDRKAFKVWCVGEPETSEQCKADILALLGQASWSDQDRTVSFRPRELQAAITYNFLLIGKDQKGTPLERTVVSFKTAAAPVPLRYTPPQGARGIPDGAYISVVFDKQMNTESLKAAFTGSVNARDGSTTRPLQISRVEAFTSSQGGFGYSFVPSEKYGDGTIVTWLIQTSAMDVGGSRLVQMVADGFSVLQRLTVIIPPDPRMTGFVDRRCEIFGCNNEVYGDGIRAGGFHYSSPTVTDVYRGFLGFHLDDNAIPENAQITKATLTLKLGSPTGRLVYDYLGPLSLQRVVIGPTLDGGDFDTPFLPCYLGERCFAQFNGPPDPTDGPLDVLPYLKADWAERATRGYRSQYRLRFANNTSPNSLLTATYKPDPTLTIEYLIP